jgi:hypothetical protein
MHDAECKPLIGAMPRQLWLEYRIGTLISAMKEQFDQPSIDFNLIQMYNHEIEINLRELKICKKWCEK